MGYEQIFPLFPVLNWNMQQQLEPSEFFEEASKWIPDEQVNWLEYVLKNDLDSINLHECPSLWEYSSFVSLLKTELLVLREGKGSTSILSSGFLTEGNPLEREERLLKEKWDFLELQKEPEKSWGLKAVFIYMLQLMILVRKASFKKKEGQEQFNKACSLETSSKDNASYMEKGDSDG